MRHETFTPGTRVKVSDPAHTNPHRGYVDPSVFGLVGTVATRQDDGNNLLILFPGHSPGEQYVAPDCLTLAPDETPATPEPSPLVGHLTTARTSDTERAVWVYVIAALPDGKVFGVNLGSNRSYVLPEGSGMRFDTFTNVGTPENLSRLGGDVLTALTSFLSSTAALPSTETSQDATSAFERGKAEQRAADLTEFESWKASATRTAHEYANNNSLCGEFDRCMVEIGLEPRTREHLVEGTVTVTYPFSVTVETTDSDEAYEMVASDPFDYIDRDEVATYGSAEVNF